MSIYQNIYNNKNNILELASRHGAYDIRLFGSVARQTADELSDIDFLINFEKGRSLIDHALLINELEKLLGCKVDVVTENGLRLDIKENILRVC